MRNRGPESTRSDIGALTPLNLGQTDSPKTKEPQVLSAKTPSPLPPKQMVAQSGKDFDYREVARKLKQDYTHGARDAGIRHIDALHQLIKYLIQADPNLSEMLEQTARMVYTQFNIKEVSVALRSPDGLYRYVAEHGMRTDIWSAHSGITYTYDELFDAKKYKGVIISHHTRLYLAEDNPYGDDEKDTYSEHMMQQSKRKSATDSIEGDYMDIFIFGPQNETYGWIEISGTWDGRIPSAEAIRCLEVISSVLGIAINRHEMMSGLANAAKTLEQPKKPEQKKQ